MSDDLDPAGTVVILSPHLDTVMAIRYAIQDDVEVVGEARNLEQLEELLEQATPDALVVDTSEVAGAASSLALLGESYPGLAVIALARDGTPEAVRRGLLGEGAREVGVLPVDAPWLQRTARRVVRRQIARRAAVIQSDRADQVGLWTFSAASGGTGQTTLVLGIANELLTLGRQVLVADLGPVLSDAGVLLGMEKAQPPLEDLVRDGIRDVEELRETVRRHPSGLWVLPAASSPSARLQLDPDALAAFTLGLAEHVDFVLADLGAGLAGWQVPLLDAATFLFVTGRLDLPGARNLRQLCELFVEARFPRARLRPMLLGDDPEGTLLEDFRAVMTRNDLPPPSHFPRDPEAAALALRWKHPVSRIAPRRPLAIAIRKYLAPLLERVDGAPREERPEGLLARLFG